ncbi:MAG: tetratricopeptide repeat protein [Chitinophagales bacterium]
MLKPIKISFLIYRTLFTLVLICFIAGSTFAQQDNRQNLAFEYYQNGEFQKAAEVFEELYDEDQSSTIFYNYLFNALIQIKEFDKAEKIVKKAIKKFPERYGQIIDLGMLYKKQGDLKKGNQVFQQAIDELKPDNSHVVQIANAFSRYNEWEYVIKTYEKARALRNDEHSFSMELASAYENNREAQKAIPHYLNYLGFNSGNKEIVESKLLTHLESPEYSEALKTALLERIQKSGSAVVYTELLIWYFTQADNFKAAFIQARALDKRLNENGQRMINLARAASKQEAYDAAIDCYEYVLEKGSSGRYYLTAKQEMLETRQKRITTGNFNENDLLELDQAYDAFLDEFGLNRNTAKTLRQKAQLHAYYMDNYNSAISMLEELINNPQIDKKLVAECKLDLGDFYLMKEEIWEATLLYSQVDKSMDDEPLGELARYKNAQLSYYIGDFGWAQTQLSVLKGATSDLISNDAIELSVFIMDNMGLDTSAHPMELYARAELLSYQKKHDRAWDLLDSITYFYPNHNLKDDILYKKAEISEARRNYSQAKDFYEKMLEMSDPTNLLLDNALFNLAGLYENQLNQPEKAMELYQKIILEFRESIFLIEARKRFRKLRGDQL